MTKAILASQPRPRAPRLPALALATTGVLIAAGLLVYWRGWTNHVQIGYGADLPALVATELFAASASIVGFLIARRRASNVVAWLLILLGVSAAAVTLGLYGNAVAAGSSQLMLGLAGKAVVAGSAKVTPGLADPVVAGSSPVTLGLYGWLAGTAIQPAMGGLAGLLMFVFPDGRLPASGFGRWSVRVWLVAVGVLLLGAVARFVEVGLAADRVAYLPTLDNPYKVFGPAGAQPGTGRIEPGLILLLLGVSLGALSLAVRYRSACSQMRRQIRWFVLAGAIVALLLLPLGHLFLFVDPRDGRGQDLWVSFFLAASLFPVAVGLAITRDRLYDIDLIVSRTFVYGTTTAIVAGLFTASIGLSQRLFVAATGETSDLAIILTTLVAASVYTPVRRRLEGLAERFLRFEEPRLGSYGQSLREVLTLLEPEETARHLIGEAVAELHACGGWVELDDGSIDLAAGADGNPDAGGLEAPCSEALSVPIRGTHGPLGRLVLSARTDRAQYRPEDVRVLEEAARLLGRALELRPRTFPSAGGAARGRPDDEAGRWLRSGEPLPVVTHT